MPRNLNSLTIQILMMVRLCYFLHSKDISLLIRFYHFGTENWDAYTGQEEGAGPSTSRAHDDEEEDYYEPHCEDPDFNVSFF